MCRRISDYNWEKKKEKEEASPRFYPGVHAFARDERVVVSWAVKVKGSDASCIESRRVGPAAVVRSTFDEDARASDGVHTESTLARRPFLQSSRPSLHERSAARGRGDGLSRAANVTRP